MRRVHQGTSIDEAEQFLINEELPEAAAGRAVGYAILNGATLSHGFCTTYDKESGMIVIFKS
jgi:hypothetical protein